MKRILNQPDRDVIGKRKKFRRFPLHPEALVAIRDYLKGFGNGAPPDGPVFKTLGKHGPYEKRGLTPEVVV